MKRLLQTRVGMIERFSLDPDPKLFEALAMVRLMIDAPNLAAIRQFADVSIPNPDFDPTNPTMKGQEETTIGRYVLAHLSWQGRFKLHDPQTIAFLDERAAAVHANAIAKQK